MNPQTSTDLHRLFNPKSIAVVGASTKRGYTWDSGNAYINGCVRQSFAGRIFPVHPKAESILGYKCYRSILDIPEPVDLAVFCVRASSARDVMEACAQKGIRFVHMLTAGWVGGRQRRPEPATDLLLDVRFRDAIRSGPRCLSPSPRFVSPAGGPFCPPQ